MFGMLNGAWAGAMVLTPLLAGALEQQAGAEAGYLAVIVPSAAIAAWLMALARALAAPTIAPTLRLTPRADGRPARRLRPAAAPRRDGSSSRRTPVRASTARSPPIGLQAAQLLQRDVAADPVPGLLLAQLGLGRLADLADLARAAGLERAAARRIGGAGDLALEPDPQAVEVVERRDRRQQRLGVGVVRAGEHLVGGADLHHPAEVEDDDPVGQVAHHAEVVADEQVGDLLASAAGR